MKRIALLLGKLLILLAAGVFPLVCYVCRLWWYQPEEPEGFQSFKFDA